MSLNDLLGRPLPRNPIGGESALRYPGRRKPRIAKAGEEIPHRPRSAKNRPASVLEAGRLVMCLSLPADPPRVGLSPIRSRGRFFGIRRIVARILQTAAAHKQRRRQKRDTKRKAEQVPEFRISRRGNHIRPHTRMTGRKYSHAPLRRIMMTAPRRKITIQTIPPTVMKSARPRRKPRMLLPVIL